MKTLLPTDRCPLVLIEPSASVSSLLELPAAEVIELYRNFGAILLRSFPIEVNIFTRFADQFCGNYVNNKSHGRRQISADGRVQTVNLGERHFPLHPEISREPWQPDMVLFACSQPADSGGETTLCDGVAIANNFAPSIRQHLMQQSLAHKQPTTLEWCASFVGKNDLKLEEAPAYSDPDLFIFSLENDQLYRTYLRPMLHKPMFAKELAYGNFLVFARRNLNSRTFPTYADGSEVPDALVDEIEHLSNALSYAHKWRKNDLLMLDNTRFMHGRNPIGGNPRQREIFSQFGYLSFLPDDYHAIGKNIWR